MRNSSVKIVNKYRSLKQLVNNSGDSGSAISFGDVDIKLLPIIFI